MGRPPKPAKLATGKISKEEKEEREKAENEIKGESDLVFNPPPFLSEAEKEVYLYYVNTFTDADIICNKDTDLLAQLAISVVKMRECNDIIKHQGIVIIADNGKISKNPAVNAYKDYNAVFNSCLRELGLNPVGRSKMAQLSLMAKENDGDALLNILGNFNE